MSVHMQYAPYKLRAGSWNDRAQTLLADIVLRDAGDLRAGHHRASSSSAQVITPLDLET